MTPNRMFNPRTGRWTQPDPHWDIRTNAIFGDSPTMRNDRYMPSIHAILQSGNLFMFVMHNPVRWVDSSGLFAACPTTTMMIEPSGLWICPITFKHMYQMAKPYLYKAWDGFKWVGVQTWEGIKWVGYEAVQGVRWWGNKIADGGRWVQSIFSRGGAPPNWGNLSRAAEFGTRTYVDMKRALQGTGLHAHHIVDQRFGLNIDITVAVTRAEHQIFTNAMRAHIPFGTMGVTKEQVWSAAQDVYANFPAILEAIRLALGV